MNELRWIILGIGILIIAFIYIWETLKRKRAPHKKPADINEATDGGIQDLHISPGKEKNIDISSAVAAFNSYLRDTVAKKEGATTDNYSDVETEIDTIIDSDFDRDESGIRVQKQTDIIVIYIVATDKERLKGEEILAAFGKTGMQYGDMQIFHYQWHNSPQGNKPLFSIANIHEPGTFDPQNMQTFQTRGLAMFMSLPADIGGDIAQQLNAKLIGADHEELHEDAIEKLRKIAHRY